MGYGAMSMEAESYQRRLLEVSGSVGIRGLPADELVGYIIDWLEDGSGPFGDGWDMFRQAAPVLDQGEPTEDAVPGIRLRVLLADMVSDRRLAWVLADLDGIYEVTSNYLRHWAGDPDMTAPGDAVMAELSRARSPCLRALGDGDARSRGYAASLLTQLRGDARPDSEEERQLEESLQREDDPVAATTMLLALAAPGDGPSRKRDAISRLQRPGAIGVIWGGRYPALPMAVAGALAEEAAEGG